VKVYSLEKIIVFVAFLIGMPFFAMAQKFEIQGIIFDNFNKPIFNCLITISDTENVTNILGYKSSDINGNFKIILNSDLKLDSIWVNVKHISYETVRLKLPFKNLEKDIILDTKVKYLEEVLIKQNKSIRIKGDTITYNVKSVKADKDYTIEDVINRIPGVTISESGQIKYLEKPISHLYINDVDLLEGRYNIATQGIPADAVKEIDIMRNHNHDRIDIGRTESEKVAFNLKIHKDVNLFFGSLKADVGVPLIKGQIDVTPIFLKDKFQNIGSFKLNNTGKTLRGVGNDLTLESLNMLSLKLKDEEIIRAPNINGVVLSDKYWLDNDSYAITDDALYKVNDNTLIKWNINYVNELSKIESKSSTIFLNHNEFNNIDNYSNNNLRTQKINVGVNQEINRRNFYLKNATNFSFANNNGLENVILNNNELNSDYSHNYFNLNNNTNIKTLIGNNNILQSGLIVEYIQKSEQLNVSPPIFETLIGDDLGNNVTLQNVNVNKFNLSGFSAYNFKFLKLDWSIHQDASFNYINFNSSLRQIPEWGNENFPFSSDFNYKKFSSETKINSKINLGKVKFSWGFTSEFQSIGTNEYKDLSLKKNDSFLFIQPSISFSYKMNSKWNLGASYVKTNKVSNFSELYTPIILTSYNSIVQNPDFINSISTQSFATHLTYNNILKNFFFSLGSNLNYTNSDVTFSNELNSEGFIITNVVQKSNTINNYGFTLNLTKGFLGLFKSDLFYSYNLIENQLFFNNQFLGAFNRRHSINLGISWDKGSWFSLEYKTKLNLGFSELPNNKIDNSILFQTAILDFYTSTSTRLNFGLESSRTKSSATSITDNNTLFNISFFYKPSKKVNFSASLLNVFDTKYFTTTNGIANFINVYQFSLRERQLTVGVTYSL
jgi:hypothetical protein